MNWNRKAKPAEPLELFPDHGHSARHPQVQAVTYNSREFEVLSQRIQAGEFRLIALECGSRFQGNAYARWYLVRLQDGKPLVITSRIERIMNNENSDR